MAPKSRQKAPKAPKAPSGDAIRAGAKDASNPVPRAPKPDRPLLKPLWPSRITAAVALGLLAYGARNAMRIPRDSLDTWAGQPLQKVYTGMVFVDGVLMKLVSAFSYPLSGNDAESRLQLEYFIPMLGAAALVWTLEGWKRDHR